MNPVERPFKTHEKNLERAPKESLDNSQLIPLG